MWLLYLLLSLCAFVAAQEKVFLTGGSGYLGRNIIRHYVSQGTTVHALARSAKSLGIVESLGAVGFLGDLSNVTAITAAARGCSATVHAAAYVKVWGPMDEAYAVTVQGTRNVMQASAVAGVSRAVHVGTEAGCIDATGASLQRLDETTPLPETPFAGVYSTTKNKAERAALEEHYGALEVVGVRPRFIWGRDDTVLLPQLAEAANGGILSWFDGGNYLTSTVHVDNVVEGIVKALEKGQARQAYFLTDGDPVVFKDFVSKMLRAIDVEPPTSTLPLWLAWSIVKPMEAFCSIFPCEPLITGQALVLMAHEVTVVDALARRELGYEGKVTHENGLKELHEMYLEQKRTSSAKRDEL